MKIVVLAGGISTEREVSIVSGTGVCKALRQKGHRAILVDVFCGDERVRMDDAQELFPEVYDVDEAAAYIRSMDGTIEAIKRSGRAFFGPNVIALCQAADVVFLALHGADGEGGTVQAAFDLMRIPYTGSGHLGSALAMDKGISRQILQECGVPTVPGMTLKRTEKRTCAQENGVGLPCIVKPCCGGSSVGVVIARTEEEYQAALETAFGYEEEVVVERFIEGREFSVGVIDDKVYPVIEIAPIEGFYDYKNKYTEGSAIETCPALLSEGKTKELQQYAKLAYRVLRLEGYGRMDFMMDADEHPYCLEANTLPGMTPTSLLPQEAAAEGIDFPELCELLIRVSLRRFGRESAAE